MSSLSSPNTSVSNSPSPNTSSVSNSPSPNTSVSNNPSSGSAPATGKRMPCTQEVALQCDGGLVDGCLSNQTNWHICVEKGQNTTPCTKEIALKCGTGKTDACLIDPKASKVHVCAKN